MVVILIENATRIFSLSVQNQMLFHTFWRIYTAEELDSHAKYDQSLKKGVGRMTENFCAKDTPSGFVSTFFFP